MKGRILTPLLSLVLIAPISIQAQSAGQADALERAQTTIQSADEDYNQRESEVLYSGTTGADVAVESPDLPEEPVFEVPSDEVFLDLPGANQSGSAVAVDAETISVDFPEEDVRDIIRSVSELYELNVVIPDSLAGSVSIKLRDVTWQQVFEVVLEPLNYTYVIDGNIIKIKSQEELAVEPVDTRVFIVDFAKASEIQNSIQPLVDPASGGKIQVDTRSNALVITERPSRMNDIQEIIETLDRPTEQVMIESKFIEISMRDSEKLGINWQSLDSWTFGVQGNTSTSSGNNESVGGEITWPMDDINLDSAVLATDAFRAILSALDTMTDTQLVSNPTVVTMNNSPAQINIGEEYPIPSYTYNDERGTFEISSFEYKNIGINLSVTPQINSAGFVNLAIQPEISSRTGVVQFGGASGAEIPIISTRKTNSTVTVKSGYTLAIGGLIQQETENGSTRVPVLGEVPFLGGLFRSKADITNRRNLIVFITAKILSASGATYEDVFSKRTLHDMGIKSRDIPGFEPDEEETELYEDALEKRNEVDRLKTEYKIKEEMMELDSVKEKKQMKINEQAAEAEESRPYRAWQG